MILCVDIGNSNITLGGFDKDVLTFVAELSTDTSTTSDEYAVKILNVLNIHGIEKKAIAGAAISSVVPQLNSTVIDAIRYIYDFTPLVIGPGIKTGINIHCDVPSSVGSDLICASAAAHFIYKKTSLVIDMGTATKMIAVDENGTFVGVSIIPGVLTGLNALCEQTAQLPHISLKAPQTVIARNTADCMRSGVIFGHASMVDGMIERIKSEFDKNISIYVTGKYSTVIVPHCTHEMTLDEYLVLKGLNIIYQKNI